MQYAFSAKCLFMLCFFMFDTSINVHCICQNHWSPRRRACFLMKEDLQCKEDWVSGSRNCKMPGGKITSRILCCRY